MDLGDSETFFSSMEENSRRKATFEKNIGGYVIFRRYFFEHLIVFFKHIDVAM